MATRSRDADLPLPPIGVKRFFTLPATLQHPPPRRTLVSQDAETQTIETLYAHANARIVHFTTSGPGAATSDRRHSSYTIKEQQVPGTLSWKSTTERTAAAGAFRIYRVPGSVAFLNAGASFLKPVLAKSQCWCVDGEGIFVLKRGPTDYYRIELPYESDQEKDAANDFRTALDHVLLFEKTPCPFQRGFHVDLPDSPQVTYVPWKVKHRPISPIRPTTATSRSSSRRSSLSGDTPEHARSSPAREYSPSPLRRPAPPASIKPFIGRFEVIDKDHQRDRLLSRGRTRSPSSVEPASPQQSPSPADFDSTSPLFVGRTRSHKLPPTRFPQSNRVVTAPPSLIIKHLEAKDAAIPANVAPSVPSLADTLAPEGQASAAEAPPANEPDEKLAVSPAANQSKASIEILDGEFETEQLLVQNDPAIIKSAAPLTNGGQDELERNSLPPEVVQSEELLDSPSNSSCDLQHSERMLSGVPSASPDVPFLSQEVTSRPQDMAGVAAEEVDVNIVDDINPVSVRADDQLPTRLEQVAQDSGIAGDHVTVHESQTRLSPKPEDTLKLEDQPADFSPPSSSRHDDSGHTSPITLDSRPDFGVDTIDSEVEGSAGKVIELTQQLQPARERYLKLEPSTSINADPYEEPDTPVWHSAAETAGSSSNSSAITSSTGASFVTAPLISPDTDGSTPSLGQSALLHQASRSTLSVPSHQRSLSRSPLPMTANLYLSHQDTYEHIGAVIGEKMAGALLGPPLQLAAVMLRMATRFTNGVRIRDEEGRGWERRAEKGRRLPGTWESYSEDEGEIESEWEEDYGVSAYGLDKHQDERITSGER